jgi:serine/threonine protein kinase
VFDLRQVGASKTFLSECETLRSARHHNLISIVTCCSSVDAAGNELRAQVFDFMPNSSLDWWLHADGLSYLHDSCSPPILHCDLKPGNVILDDDMTARIGDFSLAKLLLVDATGAENTESTIGIRGTIGYVAPGNCY